MVGTQRCQFCGQDIEPGTGTAFVRTKDGSIHWFCSKKCKVKSLKQGFKPRETKWTTAYEKGGKEK